MSEILTIDLKELEEKVENGKGFNHTEATVLLEFVRKIIGNGGTVQSQLTIPQSVADELDKVKLNWNTLKDEAQGWPSDDLIMWLDAGNNPLMFAYLAGKSLGVDLVKVVEG